MAVITTSFDTKTKALSVVIDGAEVADVVEVHHCLRMGYYDDRKAEDDFRCCITTLSRDEDADVQRMTRLTAAETSEGVAAIGAGAASPLPGFVVAESRSSLREAIASWFGVK